ncbi:type IV pilus modification protein PilV [Solimonas flava]|uniref:type IV pilus modification protein PilV n=1 Tax=Solimonas flava TaxID=415849 RepID=UPI00040E5DF9|nr:type IV pilus modification protein PilV [Solimonas flava]
MNPHPASSAARRCGRRVGARGAGLIEVLVAVLILSIGFLGIALVQTRALSQNNSSMGRSMAIVASYSILEAMRADRANALSGAYDTTVVADNCPASGTLAETQISNWCSELSASLGGAATTTGTIDCDAGGTCTVTIQFDDSRVGASGDSEQTVVTKAML